MRSARAPLGLPLPVSRSVAYLVCLLASQSIAPFVVLVHLLVQLQSLDACVEERRSEAVLPVYGIMNGSALERRLDRIDY